MIEWVKTHQRSALICGLTLLLPFLVYLNLLFSAWGLSAEYSSDMSRLPQRIARLEGLQEVEDALRESSAAVQQSTSRLVYPSTAETASVAASMQSDVRQLMAEAGLTVSNSQVLPVREEDKFDYIGVKLTVNGSVEGLDQALAELASFAPLIVVEGLDVWPTRQRTTRGAAKAPPVQDATISVRLLSLRSLI
ncbi:MAG: type II secretion system protein GspM [Halioglobus sp.]